MASSERIACDVCSRPYDAAKLPFLCPVDARNACYVQRLELLEVLVANDSLTSEIEAAAAAPAASGTPSAFMRLDRLRAETEITAERTRSIRAASAAVRAQIARQKEHMAIRRRVLERRRGDLESAALGLEDRREHQVQETQRTMSTTLDAWRRDGMALERTRMFLCEEVAKIFGPKLVQRLDNPKQWSFEIGGIEVVDLTNMNHLSPEVISTSLANIAHLLVLVSHYLSIKLAAEITLPHKDYPRPTIYSLNSSYQVSPRSSSSARSKKSSSSDSRSTSSSGPSRGRPRPLFITKSLAVLAKDEPQAHNMFLEGCTLLAYNVAWVCISQGITFASELRLSEATNMGLNLYALLYRRLPPPVPPSAEINGGPDVDIDVSASASASASAEDDAGDHEINHIMVNTHTFRDRLSHGSAFNFTSARNGHDWLRFMRFPPPLSLCSKVKTKLLTDLALPEWELLDTHEWQADEAPEEADAVMVSAVPLPESESGRSEAKKKKRVPSINGLPWTKLHIGGVR